MRINLGNLLTQLSSTEANERMAGIRILQEDLSVGKPDLTPEIVQVLSQIATTDDNTIVKAEAKRLVGRDEYLDLYKRLGVNLPPAMPYVSNEKQTLPLPPLSIYWKVLAVLSVLSFLIVIWSIFDLQSNPIGEGIDAMVLYCFFLPCLVCTVAFWILLSRRWLSGWRKTVLILLAAITLTPLAFYLVFMILRIVQDIFS